MLQALPLQGMSFFYPPVCEDSAIFSLKGKKQTKHEMSMVLIQTQDDKTALFIKMLWSNVCNVKLSHHCLPSKRLWLQTCFLCTNPDNVVFQKIFDIHRSSG